MRDVAIAVPCYDEALRLAPDSFAAFTRADPRVRFVFVDDGSTDETPDLLEELVRREPGAFELVRLKENRGKAEAVRAGVLRALEGAPRYVGYWDADHATPLAAIADFVARLDAEPELRGLFGARLPGPGRRILRKPTRRWLGRAFARLAGIVLGARYVDTQCGAKLFRASPELARAFRAPFRVRWAFDVELLARLRDDVGRAALTATVVQQPLATWHEVAGSKVRPRDVVRAAADLLRIRARYGAGAD